jgi:hypothetical protein
MEEQQRCAIDFCVRIEKSGSETPSSLWRRVAVFKWRKRFRDGETDVKNERGNVRPSTAPAPLSSWSLRQTVCSTFSRSGWRVVRSASLAKGGTSKKRPSPHHPKIPTRSNKVSPRTSQKRPSYIDRAASGFHFQAFFSDVLAISTVSSVQ